MIYSSLAVLALSASAAVGPFSNLVHLHPRPAQPDSRVSVSLYNSSAGFRDVKIDGHIYTVLSHSALSVKAPAGTVVYSASTTPAFRRGDVMFEVTPQLDKQRVKID